jgi:hypothetical protein
MAHLGWSGPTLHDIAFHWAVPKTGNQATKKTNHKRGPMTTLQQWPNNKTIKQFEFKLTAP